MTQNEINDLFNLSNFRKFKVFKRFKKIVLEEATLKDANSLQLYLFQLQECSLYEYDPADFISVIDCFEFYEKYSDDLLAINNMGITKHIIDPEGNFYGLCKNCYKAFCIDLLNEIEKQGKKKQPAMTEKEINYLFNFSDFKHLKVFERLKKMVVENACAKDTNMMMNYLFQTYDCEFYENGIADFISPLDCVEFCAEYSDDLLIINGVELTTRTVDPEKDIYGFCKNCYTAFCIDLYTEIIKFHKNSFSYC